MTTRISPVWKLLSRLLSVTRDITEQSEVDAMAKAIEDAIAALQYKDADYTER